MPAGAGAVEARGLDFYDRLVDGLLARGVTPWLCLYHWDLPQALQDEGGWVNRDIAEKFADYARVVARRLGDRVKHWAMLNEPNVHALFGYGVGSHAPGVTGLPNMLAAIHHQNLAQGRALQALRAEHADLQPRHRDHRCSRRGRRPIRAEDRRAAERFDAFWNGALLDPLLNGTYPAAIADRFAPLVAAGDLAAIQHRSISSASITTRRCMSLTRRGACSAPGVARCPPARASPPWAGRSCRTGFTNELIDLRSRYGDVELYITENGACFDDRVGGRRQRQRCRPRRLLRDHSPPRAARVAAGVQLRGYFVWSLLDNFEWAEGYSRRFGVVRVDFATQKRTPKASYAYLAGIMHQG